MVEESIHYLEFGSGETVILLPSNWLTSYAYRTIAEKLSQKYHVIVPDLYRGLSRCDAVARSIDDYVNSLSNFTEKLKIKNFHLIGISFSGLIASEFIHRNPTKLNKVMLISAIPPIKLSRNIKISMFQGFTGYIKLFFNNSFSLKGIRLNVLWLYDGIFNYFIKNPKQFLIDPIIVTESPICKITNLQKPTKLLLAEKDEFMDYKQSEIPKVTNFEVEVIQGNHTWFFLDENLLVNKVFDFFK